MSLKMLFGGRLIREVVWRQCREDFSLTQHCQLVGMPRCTLVQNWAPLHHCAPGYAFKVQEQDKSPRMHNGHHNHRPVINVSSPTPVKCGMSRWWGVAEAFIRQAYVYNALTELIYRVYSGWTGITRRHRSSKDTIEYETG